MTEIIIHRSLKRPGILDGARAYRIQADEKGLYVINLGRCTLEMPRSNAASEYLAGKILQVVDTKFEKKIRETENRISTQGIESVASEKKSAHIPWQMLQKFEYSSPHAGECMLRIEGPHYKIKLQVHASYMHELAQIKALQTTP